MTAGEIDALMRGLDWSAAFRDRPARNTLNFRRKQDDREFLVRFPLGIKGGSFRVPRGLIQGQRLTQTLRLETLPVAAVEDFDALPTPFRAVAADLETTSLRRCARACRRRACSPLSRSTAGCWWTAAWWRTCPSTSPSRWASTSSSPSTSASSLSAARS
jgi:predicted acylesterase/phospholipase RssA